MRALGSERDCNTGNQANTMPSFEMSQKLEIAKDIKLFETSIQNIWVNSTNNQIWISSVAAKLSLRKYWVVYQIQYHLFPFHYITSKWHSAVILSHVKTYLTREVITNLQIILLELHYWGVLPLMTSFLSQPQQGLWATYNINKQG